MLNELAQEQAEAIVRACKYPSNQWKNGVRGAGGMFAPAAFNQNGREYLLGANDNVMICVQIETRKAVENVEEIASVEGIGKNAPILNRSDALDSRMLICSVCHQTCSLLDQTTSLPPWGMLRLITPLLQRFRKRQSVSSRRHSTQGNTQVILP
jgi:hypothetical protein